MTVADLNSATLELLRAAAKSTDKTYVTALDVATSHNLSTRAIVNELRLIREAMHLASPFTSGTGASSPPESLTAQALTSLQAGDLKQAAEADRESMKMICLELAEAYQRIFAQGGLTLAGLQDTTITTPADLELVQYDNALSKWVNRTAAASGLVVGPGSATDNAVCRFDLTTGKFIQDSSMLVDDSGNVSGVGAFTAGGVATFNGTLAGTAVLDEDDMASDSEVKIATQQSIKAYVDTVTANFMENLSDDTTPEFGGDVALAATGVGARSFSFDHATTAILFIKNLGVGSVNLLVDGVIQSDTLTAIGNITVGGTVDGRDLQTDGAKLDGIEASADVTDPTNVTAAGALMSSGGTITGDLTVDGEIKGSRMLLFGGNTGTSMNADSSLNAVGSVKLLTGDGYVMPRPGSIVGGSFLTDIIAFTSSGTLRLQLIINDANAMFVTTTISSTGKKSIFNTQARGLDTFVAGDRIRLKMNYVSGDYSYDDTLAMCEIVFDT